MFKKLNMTLDERNKEYFKVSQLVHIWFTANGPSRTLQHTS